MVLQRSCPTWRLCCLWADHTTDSYQPLNQTLLTTGYEDLRFCEVTLYTVLCGFWGRQKKQAGLGLCAGGKCGSAARLSSSRTLQHAVPSLSLSLSLSLKSHKLWSINKRWVASFMSPRWVSLLHVLQQLTDCRGWGRGGMGGGGASRYTLTQWQSQPGMIYQAGAVASTQNCLVFMTLHTVYITNHAVLLWCH